MRSPGPRGALAVAVALVLVGVAGCGGSDSAERRSADAGARIGEPVRLVNCEDWREADVRERFGTVRAIREFAGGPVGSPAGRGATLDDDKAYELFESYCANDFADRFQLYRLYTRAAAFGAR